MRALWRVLLTLVVALPFWLATSSAFAQRAPHCDKRGASAYAPPPQLQETLQSLNSNIASEACGDDEAHQYAAPDDAPIADAPDASPVATLPTHLVVALPASRLIPHVHALSPSDGSALGVRSRLARPPRCIAS